MNSDIRLSIGFLDHPKTIKLERKLGLEGVMSLLRLWLWTVQNRSNGVLTGLDEDDLEIVARWDGEKGLFHAVTTALKFVDERNGVFSIHDWSEHNSWQAEAESRSNQSRFARMADTHPDIFKMLKSAGFKGISREQYDVITASNAPQRVVEHWLTERPSPYLPSPCLSQPCLSSPEPLPTNHSLSEPTGSDEVKKSRRGKCLPAVPEDSPAFKLATLMAETLKANLPTFKTPNLSKWAHAFDVAIRNDQRMANADFVAEVIRWACADDFWRANIQSPEKLREKFDQLTAKMENARKKKPAWKSAAELRVEANSNACQEAKRMLFGDTTTSEVHHD